MDETEHCCTTDKPCQLNQGDCDHDAECEEGLVCGSDNCGNEFSWTSADCCTKPGLFLNRKDRMYQNTCLREVSVSFLA